MSDQQNIEDARFADEILAGLPATPVLSALEARILADFDRIAARRAPGALSRTLRRWRDTVWPGAPVWQPASVLALSLAVGMMAGVLMPSAALTANTATAVQSDQQTASGDALPIVNMTKDL